MVTRINGRSNVRRYLTHVAMFATLLPTFPAQATNGHVMIGAGSINESMGGAGIATGIDAIGSNYNNVASISLLKKSSIEFGAELFAPHRDYSGSIDGGPSGTVESKTREAVIPSFGLVYKTDTPWTLGFSALGIGGFGVDYPANAPNPAGNFNPLAVPQNFGGFGAVYSDYQLLQMTPSVAYQITPEFSVGVGVNIDWAKLSVNPWPATPPNASGYPSGSHGATAWGKGFTVGAVYKPLTDLTLGVSFKSPQWFNDFGWNSQYPDGTSANFNFNLDYPMIVGAGLSYEPTRDLTLAADLKWINYSDTAGFKERNFAASATGPYVRGFGWDNIWTVSLGTQYKVSPRFTLRGGYNYGDSPIASSQQFFNIFAPAIVKHHITAGAGYNFTQGLEINIAYYHAFQNEQSGAFISNGAPANPALNEPIPGTQVTNRMSEDSFSAQVAYKF